MPRAGLEQYLAEVWGPAEIVLGEMDSRWSNPKLGIRARTDPGGFGRPGSAGVWIEPFVTATDAVVGDGTTFGLVDGVELRGMTPEEMSGRFPYEWAGELRRGGGRLHWLRFDAIDLAFGDTVVVTLGLLHEWRLGRGRKRGLCLLHDPCDHKLMKTTTSNDPNLDAIALPLVALRCHLPDLSPRGMHAKQNDNVSHSYGRAHRDSRWVHCATVGRQEVCIHRNGEP